MKQGITPHGRTYKRLILGTVGLLMASGGSMASAQLAPVTTANLGKGWNLGNSLDAEQTRGKFPLTTSRYEIESEMIIRAGRAGGKIASVPVETIYADETSFINPLVDTGRFLRMVGKSFFW